MCVYLQHYMNILKYIALPGLAVLLGSCGEPSSKDRFEKACSIKIPAQHEVIKDHWVDAGTEHGIRYDLQLTPESINELTNSIRNSGCYSPVAVQRNNTWVQKDRGYSFYLAKDGIFYRAEVDTITRIIRFHEAG